MNPNEKAIDILDRFKNVGMSEDDSKKCALIVCDTMMDENINLEGSYPKNYMELIYNFYYNVKREIIG